MKTYSPSQTVLFSTCPMKWAYTKHSIMPPPAIDRRTVAACAGQAWGDMFSAFYGKFQRNLTLDQCKDLAQGLLEDSLKPYKEQDIPLEIMEYLTKIRAQLPKVITKWWGDAPVPDDFVIIGVESPTGPEDTAYMDMCGTALGAPWVWDNKCKMYLEKRRLVYEAKEFETSWQMYHYAWAWGRTLQTPVVDYYIYFAIFSPTPHVERFDYAVDPERMICWENTAKQIWARMEEAESVIMQYQTEHERPLPLAVLSEKLPMVPEHRNRWGLCDMFNMCQVEKAITLKPLTQSST